MGRHLSPRYGQVILVSGCPVLIAVNWSQHWCAACAISFLLGSQTRAKSVSKHWFSCGGDGRRSVGRCTVTWLPNFLGWVDLLSNGAPRAWSSAIIMLTSSVINQTLLRLSQLPSTVQNMAREKKEERAQISVLPLSQRNWKLRTDFVCAVAHITWTVRWPFEKKEPEGVRFNIRCFFSRDNSV